MNLTDMLPLENWVEFEQEIANRFGLDANVFNAEGVRISDFKNWINKLCPAIKDTDKGQAFICAVAHMNLAAQAKQSGQAVIEECDAGLMKIVVPIIVDGALLGAVGACGVLLDNGEVDTFLVNKITEIDEDRVEQLSESVGTIDTATAEAVVAFLQERIARIVNDFTNAKKRS
jgi:ligand-binding sensor protein